MESPRKNFRGREDRGRNIHRLMKEVFLILCRQPSRATLALESNLRHLAPVVTISDSASDEATFIPDEQMQGFTGLCSFGGGPQVTAWERAFKYLADTDYQNVWFIEDDVAGSPSDFQHLFEHTVACNADLSAINIKAHATDWVWPHWHLTPKRFHSPLRSFNPLCRLSQDLVSESLRFREGHGSFCFQEILFASLTAEKGLSFNDWTLDPGVRSLFSSFRYQPHVEKPRAGICHPVKNLEIHVEICHQDDEKRI